MAGETKDLRPVVTPEPEGAPPAARNADASARSPVAGMDMATFREQLRRAIAGDDGASPALLARVNVAAGKRDADAKTRGLDWWERYFWQVALQDLLRPIDRYIDGLNRMADDLRGRMAERQAKIAENERWIEDAERRHKGAAAALGYYKENGVFERDENGKLKNPDAQALLDAYVKRTGQRPESDTAIAIAIERQKEFERQEAERRKRENKGLHGENQTDADRLKEIEEKVRRAIERRDAIAEQYKDDPARAEEEIKKFWQQEGERDPALLAQVQKLEAGDTTIQREANNQKNDVALSKEGDEDMDLSTFKKPRELASNFNAKVAETQAPVQLAENAAPDYQRGVAPPRPQMS